MRFALLVCLALTSVVLGDSSSPDGESAEARSYFEDGVRTMVGDSLSPEIVSIILGRPFTHKVLTPGSAANRVVNSASWWRMMSSILRRMDPNPPTSPCPYATKNCLPSYNDVRDLFGLSRVGKFKDLVIGTDIRYATLKELYGSMDNLDFYVGALLEPTEKYTTHFGSEEVGETFAAVVREYPFIDSRHPRYAGDRFWDGWQSDEDYQ